MHKGPAQPNRGLLNAAYGVFPEAKHIEAALHVYAAKQAKKQKKLDAPAEKAEKELGNFIELQHVLQKFLGHFRPEVSTYVVTSSSSAGLHAAVQELSSAVGVKFAKAFCDTNGDTANLTRIGDVRAFVFAFIQQPNGLAALRRQVRIQGIVDV